MPTQTPTEKALLAENAELRARLDEAEDLLRAIRNGEVDALVVQTTAGPNIYSLQGQDAELNRLRGEILGQVSDAVIVLDDDQHLTYLNIAAEQQYGVRAFEVLGRQVSDLYECHWSNPEDEPAMADALTETGQWRGENTHIKRNGETIHVESTITRLDSGQKARPSLLAVIRDITERKLIEKKLHTSIANALARQQELEILMAEIPAAVFIAHDSTCQQITGNPAATELLREQPGQNFSASAPDHERPKYEVWSHGRRQAAEELPMQKAVATRRSVISDESELVFTDGEKRYIVGNAIPLFDEHEEVRGCIGVFMDITERKRMEDRLLDSEEFNRSILNNSADCIKIIDLKGNVVYMNRPGQCVMEIEDFTGFDGTPWVSLWPAEGRVLVEAALRAARAGGVGHFQGYCPTAKGTPKCWDVNVTAIADADGQPRQFVSVSRDITEQRKLEVLLRESKERIEGIVASAMDAIISVNVDQRIVLFNAAAEKLFCCSAKEAIDSPIERFIPLRSRDKPAEHIRRFRETDAASREMSQMNNIMGLRADGEEFPIEASISQTEINGQKIFTVIVRDISERKRAEQALRDSEQRMRLATETTGIGIWEWNVTSNWIQWDAEMFRIYGNAPTPDGIIDYSVWSGAVLPEDLPRQEEILQDTVRRLGHSSREFRIRRGNDGECRHIQSVETVRVNAQGQVERVVGTNLDITERKQAEIALMEADRQKNEFLAMLGHELRNPLTPISNVAQILCSRPLNEATLTRACDMLNRNVAHISQLVDDLLDVSRITRGVVTIQKVQVGLADLLKQAIEPVQDLIKSKRHTLNLQLPSLPVYLEGDPVRLTQVFTNLLNNANKYTGEGGHIDLSVDVESPVVSIRIKDNGMGIEPQLLPYLFDLFTQGERGLARSEGGLGLGLALVKKLVELHGGQVTASSQGANQGSEFVVKLPILVEAPVQSEPVKPHGLNNENGKGLRILVIDDNEGVIESISIWLEMAGHHVEAASNGTLGLAAAQRFVPEIILLDVGLPDMDGYQVAKKLREQPGTQGRLIVALSGYAPNQNSQTAAPDSFDHYLVKPPKISELQGLIADFQHSKLKAQPSDN